MAARRRKRLILAILLSVAPLLNSLLLAALACCAVPQEEEAAATAPNVIVIFADDLGYSDLSCYGAQDIRTPRLDRMAQEGMRFTDFYVCTAVCTPSRAGLLTGRYPQRYGLGVRVLFPYSKGGLPLEETTVAEVLRERGYRTACIGKWHLGHSPEFMPTRQGFDEYYGVPYSNDMDGHYYKHNDFQSPPLPVYRGEEQIEAGPDQRFLTRRWTEDAVRFIDENHQRPFFLYLAHNMPHLPIHPSPGFRHTSKGGRYGDVIEEIDWSVGRILDALDHNGIAENTLVLFTSDNGPWHKGSAAPLRGKKNTTWEGGHRVPAIVRWPGQIRAGSTCHAWASTLDLLPTLAHLTGAPLPQVELDGHDITPHLLSTTDPPPDDAPDPNRVFYYYRDNRLQAIRSGRWKLHVHRPEWSKEGPPPQPLLYDLVEDPAESNNVASEHPDLLTTFFPMAIEARTQLGYKAQSQ